MRSSICTRPPGTLARPVRATLAALALGLLAGCVTVNVYFPAAAAQKAADKIIDAVTGSAAAAAPAQPAPQAAPATQPPSSDIGPVSRTGSLLAAAAGRVLTLLVPSAQAAEPANLDISTPQIRAIIADMHERFALLKPYFQSGVIGVTAAGNIAVRDESSVPLIERAKLTQLVSQQNSDLTQLYSQIADANGHPEWAADIGDTFANRWIAHAKQQGWYYRDGSGRWIKG